MTDEATYEGVAALLAEVLGLDVAAVLALPPDSSLLRGPLGLSSSAGARLLVAVEERFGVDVAAEDLSLDSLESLATLTAFVAARRTPSAS